MTELLIKLTAVLFETTLVIISPALISWVAYLVHPDLGLAGLGVGMVAGPYGIMVAADFIAEVTA
tara:strand:- start:1180 stop:1374 length:195 start_codon:yes stop_codon:yes gene_type:complete